MPGRQRERSAGARKWGYGLADLLVIASCSLVFLAIVTGTRGTGRKAAVDAHPREVMGPGALHHPAMHDGAMPEGAMREGAPHGPGWTPARPR